MIKMKKIITLATVTLVIGTMSISVFAASEDNTNETIASESGCSEEFKEEMLNSKKEVLAQKVAEGIITQERSDEIIKALEENAATCDGSGSARIGQEYGVGFGVGSGSGNGSGCGTETGSGNGNRMGNGQGSCLNN